MSTVFPFGAARCIDCKAPVAIVRRTVEQPCVGPSCLCLDDAYPELPDCPPDHTHAIKDVAWAVVDAEGERHQCGGTRA